MHRPVQVGAAADDKITEAEAAEAVVEAGASVVLILLVRSEQKVAC